MFVLKGDMTYKMFIDDERFPKTSDWKIVRSSQEAIDCVLTQGFPIHINFDHDLGGTDTSMKFITWLIDYMLDCELSFPKGFTWDVHSQNPVGAENIRSIMTALVKEFS